jgi:hypothetical protein
MFFLLSLVLEFLGPSNHSLGSLGSFGTMSIELFEFLVRFLHQGRESFHFLAIVIFYREC